MAVFGVLAAALGLVGLIRPEVMIGLMGLDPVPGADRADGDHTLLFLTASSMAALNMGVYYVLAALADWKPFFRWTVPFRLLTCTVFTLTVVAGRAPAGFLGVGLWEGAGALVTGAALRYESRRAARTKPAEADPAQTEPAQSEPAR
ncbi:hypothetical protein AB0C52_22370 [Streptomyces sp. NPDC048717]|uniref:hypothetical protein n=1 Tax=Streptomyces sp. NPDC048717 TaxID=3154928 RepID=UPI003430407E